MKIDDKRGEINFSEWRRATMVLINGVTGCWGPMHALLEHTPLDEQMPMCNAIMLMEME
jgi:hypothetical protein